MIKKILFLPTVLFSYLSATVYLEPTPQFNPSFQIATVYLEYEGQILLLHRQNDKSQGNKWGIPGGKIEKDETPLQAAIREAKEETGFDLSKQTFETLQPVYVEYNERTHFVYHSFRTQMQKNPAAVCIHFDEHKGFTWVTPSDALKMDLLQDEDACILKTYFSQP